MNPLPLLFLMRAAEKNRSAAASPALPPVEVLADRLHSLTAAVDQMAALSRTLQALPASGPLSREARSSAQPAFPESRNIPYAAPQAVPFSGPPEAFGPSLSAMAQKLPSNIGQLLTPDLLQKVSALLGK